MKITKEKELFYYTVVRIVKEGYEVLAYSEEDAKNKVEDPHSITVLKEIIKKAPNDK